MKRKSQYSFARIPSVNIGRSVFDRSFTYKTTMNEGYLVPVSEPLEVLPGDTWNLSLTSFARLATPVVPFMDNLYIDFFFFFVSNRIAWPYWPQVMGEEYDSTLSNIDPGDSVPFVNVDTSQSGGSLVTSGSLADYFGIPVGVDNFEFSAIPFLGYQLIYWEHFADENLIGDKSKAYLDVFRLCLYEGVDFPSALYDESAEPFLLRKRCKRHDYFTSCLPWPQKGPGVEIPLAGVAPVVGNGMALGLNDGTNNVGLRSGTISGYTMLSASQDMFGHDVGTSSSTNTLTPNKAIGVTTDPENSGLEADLSAVSAATINTWRQAFQIQLWEEASARSGTRYSEIIEGHFGVRNPDARLQRSEFLGGGTIPINIHSVAQTSSTDTTTPQGNLAAIGVSSGRVGFSKSFTEHGYIFCLANIRADLTYQQGLSRHWSRKTKFDFYWPEFAHLGEQAVLNKEIFVSGTPAIDDAVFGYQERWAEYRYGKSMITGLLRSGVTGSLDVWHLAQQFASTPTLSQTFIEEDPPISRVVAVQNQPHFIYDSVVNVKCVRPMPVYSVPGLIDHRM